MATITTTAFAELLKNHKRCTFASVDYETPQTRFNKYPTGTKTSERSSKTPCPCVTSRTIGKSIMLGADYGNRVQNQRGREGVDEEFTPLAPRGYVHVGGLLAITTKGSPAMLYSLPKAGTEQANGGIVTHHNVDGDIINDSVLAPYKKPTYYSSGRQGTEDAIQWRCVKIENIIAIRMNGVEYEIEAPAEAPAEASEVTA